MTLEQVKQAVALGPEIYAEFDVAGSGAETRRPGDGQALRRRHSRCRCRPRLRVERYRPDQLRFSAGCAGEVREGAARERVHRAGTGEAVQGQSGEDSGSDAARGNAVGVPAASGFSRTTYWWRQRHCYSSLWTRDERAAYACRPVGNRWRRSADPAHSTEVAREQVSFPVLRHGDRRHRRLGCARAGAARSG